MFDTENFIREVRKRPALYNPRAREAGENMITYWEQIGAIIYKDWHLLLMQEERMERVRELRKKWKSVRDNFLRDIRAPPNWKKRRYVYHHLMQFLVPHLDPKRWHSGGEEDVSDGDIRRPPPRRKRQQLIPPPPPPVPEKSNVDFLLSLVPLLDEVTPDEAVRLREDMVWAVKEAAAVSREKRLIAHVASYPAVWDMCHPGFTDNVVQVATWAQISLETRLSVEECKKLWKDLTSEMQRRVMGAGGPQDKWRHEDEMTFCLPYIISRRSDKRKMRDCPEDSEDDNDQVQPLELCQVECRDSPNDCGREVKTEDDSEDRLPVELCQVECGDSAEEDEGEETTLTKFFVNMAQTVEGFPPQLQAQVKSEVFRAVNNAEMSLACRHHKERSAPNRAFSITSFCTIFNMKHKKV